MTTTTNHRMHHRPHGSRAAVVAALAAVVLLGAAPACSGNDDAVTSADSADVTSTTAAVEDPVPATGAVSSGVLTDVEMSGLLYMVEEEKLAHDVYLTLGEEWGLTTFTNITASETTHMDAVRGLLDDYGVADPTEGAAVGVFTDPTFTALYDQLVAEGSTSVTAALAVGAGIEELDIVDLEERVAQTDRADIDAVYSNLLSGSENHLRAFTGALEARGMTYEPTILDQSAYDAVLASPSGGGRRSR